MGKHRSNKTERHSKHGATKRRRHRSSKKTAHGSKRTKLSKTNGVLMPSKTLVPDILKPSPQMPFSGSLDEELPDRVIKEADHERLTNDLFTPLASPNKQVASTETYTIGPMTGDLKSEVLWFQASKGLQEFTALDETELELVINVTREDGSLPLATRTCRLICAGSPLTGEDDLTIEDLIEMQVMRVSDGDENSIDMHDDIDQWHERMSEVDSRLGPALWRNATISDPSHRINQDARRLKRQIDREKMIDEMIADYSNKSQRKRRNATAAPTAANDGKSGDGDVPTHEQHETTTHESREQLAEREREEQQRLDDMRNKQQLPLNSQQAQVLESRRVCDYGRVMLVNSALDFLFDSVQVNVNETQLEQDQGIYSGYKSFIQTRLAATTPAKAAFFAMSRGFATWEAAGSIYRPPVDPQKSQAIFETVHKECERIKNSRHVSLRGRLHASFSSMTRPLPPGNTINIHLHRAPDQHALVILNTDEISQKRRYKINIIDAKMHFHRLRLTNDAIRNFFTRWKKEKRLLVPYMRTNAIRMNIPGGVLSHIQNPIPLATVPYRMRIFFISSRIDSRKQVWTDDISMLHHYHLKSIYFKINNREIGKLKMNYKDDSYMQPYMALTANFRDIEEMANGTISDESRYPIEPHEFEGRFNLYCLDLRKASSNLLSLRQMQLEIGFEFEEKTVEPLIAVLLSDHHSTLSMNPDAAINAFDLNR